MALLKKLKTLFGLDDSDAGTDRRGDVSVTVEREPTDANSGDAVEGTDAPTSPAAGETTTVDTSARSVQDAESETAEETVEDESVDEADADASGSETAADASDDEAEPVEESSTADAPDDADEPVDDLKGIGASYADRLGDAGVETVGDLAAADAEALAAETDVSEKRLRRWIDRARER